MKRTCKSGEIPVFALPEDDGFLPNKKEMKQQGIVFALLLCVCIAAQPKFTTLTPSEQSFNLKSFIHTYIWEIVGVLLLCVYGMYFYVGRKKNIRIVENWLTSYQSLLESQFTSVGISGNYGLLMRESLDQFRLFCSGRRNCNGILFDFKLKKRQDLFSLLLDFVTPVDDIMTVDIPLSSDMMKPFVFALCRKRDYKTVHSENPDLKDMGHQVALQYTPELNKVSGNWVVISDTNEVPSSLLTPSVINVLKVSNSFLRLIHVSDNMPAPTDNRAHLSNYGIRIKVKLPAYDRMDSMSNVMEMIFDVIDAVAQVRLSPKAAATTAKVRQTMQEAQQRLDHEKRQERMQALKEQKLKEEKLRAEKNPELQRKLEEKLEKEEKKKKMRRRMQLVRG